MDVVLKLELPEDLERNIRSIVGNVGRSTVVLEAIMSALENIKAEFATLKGDITALLAKNQANAAAVAAAANNNNDAELQAIADDMHATNASIEAVLNPVPAPAPEAPADTPPPDTPS